MGVYIDREEAIKCLDGNVLITRQSEAEAVREYFEMVIKRLENLPTIDLVRCGECKYFNLNEWDETICGVPIIVAHEICHKWGDGCKTNIYGFCFMGERRADDVRHNEQQDF